MIHIETTGQGPDLALLHGWGMHGGIWEGVRDELAKQFRVHVVDLPGYGASGLVEPYTLAILAREMVSVLPQGAHLAGWSLGGQLAVEMVLTFPGRWGKLVLIGTTPCFRTRSDWAQGMSDVMLAEFAASLEQDYEGTLKRFLSLQARSGDTARATIAVLREKLFARGRPSLDVLRAGLRILHDWDRRDAVSTIANPALILHGSHDTLTPPGAGEWLAQHLPQAQWAPVRGAAHAPFLSHPEHTVKVMADFLHG